MRKNIRKLVVVFVLLLAVSLFACNGATTNGSSSLDGSSEPDSSIVLDSSSILDSGTKPDSSTVTDSSNDNSSVEEECEHQAVVDEAVAPDCENTGLTEGKHCDVCGEILVAQEEVDALGHTEVIDSAVAPDCENTGLTEGKHCEVCGEILVAQEEISASHNFVNDICTVCGKNYATDASYFDFKLLGEGTYAIKAKNADNLPNEVILPSVYNGTPVTAVLQEGFLNSDNLTSIEIPDSITSIGNYAFDSCYNLTSVIIGSGLTSLGSDVFYSSYALVSITVDKENQSFCSVDGVLYNKEQSTLVVYPAMKNQLNFVIPESVTEVAQSAFAYCSSLTSVKIGNHVVTVGDFAFMGCDALTIYCEPQNKPDSWSEMMTFGCPIVWDCNNNDLASDGCIYTMIDGIRYSIKDGVATVARQSALANNGNIAYNITHKGNSYAVTTIGENAYRGCYVSSVTIPNSVTYICTSAFELCVNLTSIVIPDSVTYMDSSIFYGCASLSSVVIGNKIQILNPLTFSRCTSLVSITLPDSVWVVDSSAFAGCTALEEFIVSESSQTFSTIDGNLYNKRQDYLERYAPGKKDASFVIPEGVTNVWGAFSDCQYLTTVTIPKSMTSIDYGAFANCYSLTTIILHDGITEIDENAFTHCGKLESIIIPEAVEIIGANAFYGCDSLVIYCEAQSKPNGWSSDWNSSGLPVYYYSETQPATSGNYWHYVNGEVVTW